MQISVMRGIQRFYFCERFTTSEWYSHEGNLKYNVKLGNIQVGVESKLDNGYDACTPTV